MGALEAPQAAVIHLRGMSRHSATGQLQTCLKARRGGEAARPSSRPPPRSSPAAAASLPHLTLPGMLLGFPSCRTLVSWGGGALALRWQRQQQHHGFCTPGTGWRSEDSVKAQQAHWLDLPLSLSLPRLALSPQEALLDAPLCHQGPWNRTLFSPQHAEAGPWGPSRL